MQAIILAAGRGSRLGGQGGGVPKCLLEVGRRRLIEHVLETLCDAGVGPVTMVVGYGADEIREVVGIRAEYLVNTRWEQTNSLYSFWLARDKMKGPLLVLNSDILLHPGVVSRVLAGSDDCFAFDSTSGDGPEHMKVRIVDGKLADMSKDLPEEVVAGENVGLLRFSAETAERLFAKAGEILETDGEKKWLGSAVREIAAEQPIDAVDIAGLPWAEIDFSYDLVRARKIVRPEIQRHQRSRTLGRRIARTAAAIFLVAAFLYLAISHWNGPVESAWGAIDLENAPRVEIRAGEQTKSWSQLEETPSRIVVDGPTELRLDTRLLLPPEAADGLYVVEVLLDGKRIGWFQEKGESSSTWTHTEYSVCRRQRQKVDIPAGQHVVEVRLVASDGVCLLRVSRKEAPEPEE